MRHVPLIGITTDLADDRFTCRTTYVEAVRSSGGNPILLAPCTLDTDSLLDRLDGLILSGGDDPIMERFGSVTDPRATKIDQRRQEFELSLLDSASAREDFPVLGICLGMQLMCLHAGGTLHQHLPDILPTASNHVDGAVHEIGGDLWSGAVSSHHKQAVDDPGDLTVVATADDRVIEAVIHPDRAYYRGVQWHPERTEYAPLGHGLIREFIESTCE